MRREMQETLVRSKGKEAGTGNIRGIGAEKRVERVETPDGVLEGEFKHSCLGLANVLHGHRSVPGVR